MKLRNANSVALLMMGELQSLAAACCFMPEELNATLSDGKSMRKERARQCVQAIGWMTILIYVCAHVPKLMMRVYARA